MKQSSVTGKHIADEIEKARKEVEEFGHACDSVESNIGRDTLAWKLLKEQHDAKRMDLSKLERQPYISPNTVPQAPAPRPIQDPTNPFPGF